MGDTESIVRDAVAGLDSSASSVSDEAVSVDTTPAETVAETPVEEAVGTEIAPEVAPEVAEAPVVDPNAVPEKKPLQGRLSLENHKKILENQRAEAQTQISALQAEVKQLEWAKSPDVRETLQAFQIAETNKPLFAKIILGDPEYQQIFQQMFAGQAPQAPAAEPEQIQPDTLMPDGGVGYSAEAVQKILSQREAALEQKFNKALDARFKDVEPVVKSVQQQHAFEQAKEANRPYVENARNTWPGFKENEKEIHAKFKEHLFERNYTLESAWREVMAPKLQTDRDAMRKELLAEINKRPAAVIKQAPASNPAAPSGGKTEDIVRAAIAGLR